MQPSPEDKKKKEELEKEKPEKETWKLDVDAEVAPLMNAEAQALETMPTPEEIAVKMGTPDLQAETLSSDELQALLQGSPEGDRAEMLSQMTDDLMERAQAGDISQESFIDGMNSIADHVNSLNQDVSGFIKRMIDKDKDKDGKAPYSVPEEKSEQIMLVLVALMAALKKLVAKLSGQDLDSVVNPLKSLVEGGAQHEEVAVSEDQALSEEGAERDISHETRELSQKLDGAVEGIEGNLEGLDEEIQKLSNTQNLDRSIDNEASLDMEMTPGR